MDAQVPGEGPIRQRERANPPAFNVPTVVLLLIASFILIHVLRTQVFSNARDAVVLLDYAFIPGCAQDLARFCFARPEAAGFWSLVTHAFLHGDWTHLGVNSAWLLAFGTPVAKRLGTVGFLLFCALGALAGAMLFYVLNPSLLAPMIGASGIVSAVMGGAARFALGRVGRVGLIDVAQAPRLGILASLSDRTVLFFVAIFFATNLLLGTSAGTLFAGGLSIAWEAHLGGFLFGFLFFGYFDRRPPALHA